MPEDRDIADLLCEKPSQCGRSRLVKVRNSKRQIRPNLVYKNVVGAEWDDIIHRYIPRADGLVRQIEQLQPHRALEAAGPVALKSFAVPYSLDKLRRWETVQRFRDGIESLQDQSIGLTVSGLELHVSPFRQYQIPSLNIKEATGSNKTDIRARAYHSVDKSGKPVHRVANQLTANIASLTEKAMPPRRKRGRRNRNQQQQHAAAVEGENEAAVGVNNTDGEIKKKTKGDWERPAHVRYVFVSEHPSCKLYDKHPLNRKDINGKQLEMFMRRKRADIQRDVFEATDEYFDEAEENVSSAAPQPYFAPLETSSVSARLEDFVVAKKSKQPKNKKTPKLPFDAAYGRWLLRGTSVEAATSSGYASDADQDLENQVQTPMRVRDQVLPMQQVEILLPEQDIQPEALRAAYKDAYFECATLPRRFVLNVSDTVRSVMNISHGADAVKTKNIQVFVVFEMQKTTQHDLKNMTLEDFDDDVGPMARIRVWLNVLLNNHAGVIISLEKCYDSEMDLNEFLKSIVVHIGTLSIDAFPCNAQTDIPLRIRKPSFVMDLLPRSLLPTTSCLKNGQVSKVALSESHMVPKIQRQTTVVAAYHSNACSLFDYLYQECAVCFADDFDLQGMALASCDHFFCSQCWIDHAVQALDAGLVPIKCMEPDCKSTVDYDTAISLLPFALCERYADQLSERHLLSNFKNWRYCRNDRCDRVIRILGQGHVGVIACDCGETFCGQCGDAVHFPASCKQAQIYTNALSESGDDKITPYASADDERRVKVKRCPSCSTPMEKNQGCNHMQCRCGAEFCWECQQPWSGGRHYSCTDMDRGFETIALRDVLVRNKSGMSYVIYDQCAALRRSTFSPNIQPIRERCAKLGIDKKSANDYIQFHIEITHLLEFTIAFVYFASQGRTKQERRARRPQLQGVLSVADRVAFLLQRWQQALDAGQKDIIDSILQRAKIISGDLARMAARYSIAL